MNIITWNILGINSPRKVKILNLKIGMENVVVMFVQETKCSKQRLMKVGRRVWRNCEVVGIDAYGAARGLGFL